MGVPYIYQRTITTGSMSGSVEQGIRLSNACFARSFGTSPWTWIRVGIRYRVSSSFEAASLTGTPRFMMGFCNGTTNIPGDATINQFAGCMWSDPTVGYSAGGWLDVYNSTANNWNVATASFGTNTTNIYNFGSILQNTMEIVTASFYADVLFVDLRKMATNVYKPYSFVRLTANGAEYTSDAVFMSLLQSTAPAKTNYSFVTTANNFSMSQATTYPFDSVCVYNERIDPAIEIIDLYVVRLA